MNENKTEAVRPLCLELEDAKNEIVGTINRLAFQRHVPFYLLEGIIHDVDRQISELARKERETAKKTYEHQLRQIAEMNERKGGECNGAGNTAVDT